MGLFKKKNIDDIEIDIELQLWKLANFLQKKNNEIVDIELRTKNEGRYAAERKRILCLRQAILDRRRYPES